MRYLKIVVLVVFLSFTICSERTIDITILKHGWHFLIDEQNQGLDKKWYAQNFDISPAELINVPEAWENHLKQEYDGTGWYFIDFMYEDDFQKTGILFNSVDDDAIVWLNGIKIGEHRGANQQFKLDASDVIDMGQNRLTVRVVDGGGPGGLNGQVELFPFESPDDLRKGRYADLPTPEHPDWLQNAVIYELNTRQFSEEGTFRAVETRLDEIKDLGVSIIWFMPVHPIGEMNRKGTLGSYYAVKDFYGINHEFGTKEDFKRLVDKIHDKDMYVIIDLVANHTAWDNQMIEKHPEWYTQDEQGTILPPNPDWTDVADLNYENKALREYMIDMMDYWVREVGIDGYRCDVAAMVPTDFWIEARKRLVSIKPVFMLAEAETPELNAYGFDMTYASAMHHLFNRIAQGTDSVKNIDKLLEYQKWNYPRGSKRLLFTSNHDENTWKGSAITRMTRGGAKVGAVLTCTLPGTPLIYNGQEVGNLKALEFFEKDPVVWRENEFRNFYKTLFTLYRNSPALYLGDMHKLVSSNDEQVYAFHRSFDDDNVLVIVNFSNKKVNTQIKTDDLSGKFASVFTKQVLLLENFSISLQLDPWEYRIYVKQ